MVPNSLQIGQAIRQERERFGRTLESVALGAGVATKTLQHLETRGGNPEWSMLRKVLKELGLDAAALMQLASSLPATGSPASEIGSNDAND